MIYKILILMFVLVSPVFAGENPPDDWNYSNGLYSVNVQDGEDAQVGTIIGPAFPEGIRVLRDFRTLSDFEDDLIVIVDALSAAPEFLTRSVLRKVPLQKKKVLRK